MNEVTIVLNEKQAFAVAHCLAKRAVRRAFGATQISGAVYDQLIQQIGQDKYDTLQNEWIEIVSKTESEQNFTCGRCREEVSAEKHKAWLSAKKAKLNKKQNGTTSNV